MVGFEGMDVSATFEDTLLHFGYDLTVTLARHAGTFAYNFGAFGWPTGWSYLGASPNLVALYWQGIPFDDPLTGRPRYDLLPTALLNSPGLAHGARSMPSEVRTRMRPMETSRPLTELHYQAGDNGLQRVTVLHAQQRKFSPGVLQGLFAYAGAAEQGEYPGSQLRRMRQLLLRTRYQQVRWSVEALYLHNQRRLGAHGGVVPSENYDAVYNRLLAVTRDNNAVRREVRNDLSLTARARVWREPLTLQLWYTDARLRYTRPAAATAEASTGRWGIRLHQSVHWNNHRLRFVTQGGRERAHLARRDSVDGGPVVLVGEARGTITQGMFMTGGMVHGSYRGFLYATGFSTEVAPASIATEGFGQHVGALPEVSLGRVTQLRVGTRTRWRAWDVDLMVFAGEEQGLSEYYSPRSDSIVVRTHSGAVRLSGAAVEIGFRSRARRGLYARMHGLFLAFSGEVPAGRSGAVPQWSGQGRVGIRYTLFTGDLKTDLSVRMRGWSDMTSRTLHSPTGLLVLPEDATLYPVYGYLPASGTIDVVAEAGVRTATLFVAYENVLSGTPFMAGNQVVPIYPLPAIRLRFGVFWPIVN